MIPLSPARYTAPFVLAIACSACASGSTVKASDAPDDTSTDRPAPGSYVDRDPQDERIAAAAEEAVELLRERQSDPSISLTRIESAQSQVVAGVNFRLKLLLQTAQGASTVDVVLYENLQGERSLTLVEGL